MHSFFILSLIAVLLPVRLSAGAIAPVISRANFTVRQPHTAKAIQAEINAPKFRSRLAQFTALPERLARTPAFSITYRPDQERGGTLVMMFDDPKNLLTDEQLHKLYKPLEAYVVQRFQGESVASAHRYVFGESPATR